MAYVRSIPEQSIKIIHPCKFIECLCDLRACSFINPNTETTVCKLQCVIETLQGSFLSTLLSPT